MRMELGAEVARALVATAAACGGTAALGTVSDWTMALLGVPVTVVLAAVAGIALVVSYQPHAPAMRLWTTVVSSIFVACSAAVYAIEAGGWPKGAASFTAAATGALLQILVPWLIAKGPELLDRVASILQARFGGGSK
jgi:hypothetical protein